MTGPHVTAIAICRYDDFPAVDPADRTSVVRIVPDQADAERELQRLNALPDRHPKSRYFATPARLTPEVIRTLVRQLDAPTEN